MVKFDVAPSPIAQRGIGFEITQPYAICVSDDPVAYKVWWTEKLLIAPIIAIPEPCWAFWEGTYPISYMPIVMLVKANPEKLDTPPGELFRPIKPGINYLQWSER